MKDAIKSKLQLFAALVVAACGTLLSDPLSAMRRLRSALFLSVGLFRSGERVAKAVADKRLATCRACPIFYKPLGTCGTPLKRELRLVGCFCHMETAAKIKAKQCWLDELAERDGGPLDSHGWKANV